MSFFWDFVSTKQQQDNFRTIFGEINPVSRAKIDFELSNALTNRFTISEISLFQTVQSNTNRRASFEIT